MSYSIKRFSNSTLSNSSIIKRSLPSSMITREGRFMEEYSLNKINLSSSEIDSIKSICNGLGKSADKFIYDYEGSHTGNLLSSDVPDFKDRINIKNLYVFNVRINKDNIEFSVASRRFEDWMGYYVLIYNIKTGKLVDVSYKD